MGDEVAGPSHLDRSCEFTRLVDTNAAKGLFKSHSWAQLSKTAGDPYQLPESAFDPLQFLGNQPPRIEGYGDSSPTTYVVTDSWPRGPLQPTTSVGTYSNHGLDAYWAKYPDSHAARIACSRSVLPPPGFDSLGADRVHQPFLGDSALGRMGSAYRLGERVRDPRAQVSSPFREGYHHTQGPSPTSRSNSNSDRSDIQNLIEAMHVMTSQISRRNAAPLSKEDLFSGDPITYRRFVKHFDAYTARGVVDMAERLDLLISSCTGEARANISDCIMARSPELGYFEARRILESLYGQDHTVVSAYVNKLIEGPLLKSNDHSGLSALSRDMRNCLMACNNLDSAGLDTQQTVSGIFKRLPNHLQDKFIASVSSHLQSGRPITFAMLADFLEKRTKVETSFLGQIVSRRGDRRWLDRASREQAQPRKASVNTVQGSSGKQFRSGGATVKCGFCPQSHPLWKCVEFSKQQVKDRWSFAKAEKLCFNCLGSHFAKACKSKGKCGVCGRNHHTLLHRDAGEVSPNRDPGAGSSNANGDGNGAGEVNQVMSVSVNPGQPSAVASNEEGVLGQVNVANRAESQLVRLRVVPVKVWGNGKELVETYAFLDEGSDTTLCTEQLLDKLKVRGQKIQFSLATVNGMEVRNGRRADLTVQGFSGQAAIQLSNVISVPVLPELRSSIPSSKDCQAYPEVLEGVTFPSFKGSVELLIGADVPGAHRTFEYRVNHSGGPNAVKCALGWALVGPITRPGHSREPEVGHVNFVQSDNNALHGLMQKMYERDFVSKGDGLDLGASLEDKRALQIMESSVVKVDGHYEIALPWKSESAKLPNNRTVAERRLGHLKNRLARDPELHNKYKDKMGEYLKNGYARKVPRKSLAPSPKTWYVPHHATGGKFRIVFDCAARFRGTSLNENLLQGPDHTSNLVGVLLRFRSRRVAVMADIKGMFHQVKVPLRDCDSLRFLWWPDGNLEASPEEFQMVVHLFGATSSPSVCGYALQRVAIDNETNAPEAVLQAVRRNFYVDDLLISFHGDSEAARTIEGLRRLLFRCGFHLTKFVGNSEEALRAIPECDRRELPVEVSIDCPREEKALGVIWNPSLDEFRFRACLVEKACTRRGILSTIGQCYDPVGMIQPALLPAKKLLQELCASGVGWDDPIPSVNKKFWEVYSKSLQTLGSVGIPRCYRPSDFDPIEAQLHCFCDASQIGYGAVLYLRFAGPDGQVHCSFVMGRSRVAPVRPTTIPRLELVAAVTGTELTGFVRKELDFDVDKVTFWTDSTSVLGYVRSTARRYRTFVANRIAIIQSESSPDQWRHVGTFENPADVSSRGCMPDELSENEMWFRGPKFFGFRRANGQLTPLSCTPTLIVTRTSC